MGLMAKKKVKTTEELIVNGFVIRAKEVIDTLTGDVCYKGEVTTLYDDGAGGVYFIVDGKKKRLMR